MRRKNHVPKKLILISLDALSCTELKRIQKLPNFRFLLESGAYCPRENSVYPSLTFPSHASIVTGCNPGTHGIVNNYLFDPFASIPKWNFYAGNLKRRALWDYAAQAGKTVLSMSWPVSADANIAYCMPEMTPAKPKLWNPVNFMRQIQVFMKHGTPGFALKTLFSHTALPKAWFFGNQPGLDLHMIDAFQRAIRTRSFDIALLHIYGMDDAKHSYGADSPQARNYLKLYDRFIGNLLLYIRERPDENITLMITGDHSQKDVRFAIYGNHILEKMGLCAFSGGKLREYEAYVDSCDGMAYLYIKDPKKQPEMIRLVERRFTNHPGVAKIMHPDEFIPLGCDPQAALVLEAAEGYGFESGYCLDPMDTDCIAANHYKALHGYLPTGKDYQTMFFAYGQDIAPGKLPRMCITDITPSICQWMGFHPDKMDGKPIEALFKEEVLLK